MKIQELREKTDAELDRMLTELRGSIQEQRFKVASRQLKQVRDIRVTKRTIAKILTLKQQRRTDAKA